TGFDRRAIAIASSTRVPRKRLREVLASDVAVVEANAPIAEILIRLVALSGDEDRVPGTRHSNGEPDRLATILDELDRVRACEARRDVLEDAARVLRARIVRRHDDVIRAGLGDGPHARALRAIAIPAATEHGDDPTRRHRAKRLEHRLERAIGVRIVD